MTHYNQQHVRNINTGVQPWPIRLVMRLGARSESQAVLIIAVVCGGVLLCTAWIYATLLSSPAEDDITPELILEMEEMNDN